VAERDPDTQQWRVFTGNELGILLGALVVEGAKARAGPAWDPRTRALLTTVVSGRMLQRLAEAEGLHYEETLTGFKWMGNAADALGKQGRTVLFAFEEAIGFMVGTTVHDKDGISALGFVAQQATRLYAQGRTLAGYLAALYERLGYSLSETRSLLCHEPARIKAFFDRFRRDATGRKVCVCVCVCGGMRSMKPFLINLAHSCNHRAHLTHRPGVCEHLWPRRPDHANLRPD
jgi:phosphomannomutase